ncbi:Transcriptional regulatory protein ZraR [Roseimaritima multifibrata]|uniref:Transcriptional regulatory protein ZraR n=1 Tax=Roseimaritima multifibrata TaxID=1930274 RepID=A0A517MHI2_9BACT|nr:sigma-54 dependent transcriptional regulator [Roseimaritima multifibrata]QDS94346.1 Transcriptional regulatory protein ZraR [Roseimaritima multifibrata]
MKRPRQARILIADDEPLYLQTTGELLRNEGYHCTCVSDANAAIQALQNEPFDLLLSDLSMPGNMKLELLKESRSKHAHVPLIVITGVPSLPTAIESIRLGIADYLLKPVKLEDLLGSVQRALRQAEISAPKTTTETSETSPPSAPNATDRINVESSAFAEIIGESKPMKDLTEIIQRVADSNANVLLTGESGTGKEVIAKAIHRLSARHAAPFQVIDCTAVPDSLFESVLFGHIKGSFTGAVKDQTGLLTEADKGTTFFDELGELPLGSQAKLLRAIQEQTFTPLGTSKPVTVDTRFICATNRSLANEVDAGRFRRDLYYRLAVIHIDIPTLRDRSEDIPLLANHFLKRLRPPESNIEGFSKEALERLQSYPWPGNIRELRNVVERALALVRTSTIEVSDLPQTLRNDLPTPLSAIQDLTEISRDEAMESAEHEYLIKLITKHAGNISQSARQAGLSRQGLDKLLKRHKIRAAEFRP